jgi:hypothetical protein
VQQKKRLFVHSHPEYDTRRLFGKYRRDMGRFLRGENEVCPTIPRGYSGAEAEGILDGFRRNPLSDRHPEFFRFPSRSAGEGSEKKAHILQLAALHGFATNRTHQTVSPQRKVSRLAVSSALAGTVRDGDRSAGHYGAPEEAREEALSATGSRARQHGRKPAAVRAGEPCPGRRPRSARRALARRPADEQAGSDPTTEFGR